MIGSCGKPNKLKLGKRNHRQAGSKILCPKKYQANILQKFNVKNWLNYRPNDFTQLLNGNAQFEVFEPKSGNYIAGTSVAGALNKANRKYPGCTFFVIPSRNQIQKEKTLLGLKDNDSLQIGEFGHYETGTNWTGLFLGATQFFVKIRSIVLFLLVHFSFSFVKFQNPQFPNLSPKGIEQLVSVKAFEKAVDFLGSLAIQKAEAAPTEGYVHERVAGQPDSVKAYTPGVPNDTVRSIIGSNGRYTFSSYELGSSFNVSAKDWSFTITNIRNIGTQIYVPDVYPNGVALDVWDLTGASEPFGVTFHLNRTGQNVWRFLQPSSEKGLIFWFYNINIGSLNPLHGDSGTAYYWARGPPGQDDLCMATRQIVFDTTRFGKNILLATDSLYGSFFLLGVGDTPYLFSIQDVQPKTKGAGAVSQRIITSNDSIPPWSFSRNYTVTTTLKPGQPDSIVLQGNGYLDMGYDRDTVTLSPIILQEGVYPRRTVVTPSNSPGAIYWDTLTVTPTPTGWQQLLDAPIGGGKKFKAGTDMCSDGNRLWVIKGGTLENWIYAPGSALWIPATSLPAGAKGKAKRGSSIIYANGKIYYKEAGGPGFWAKDTVANAPWIALANYTINGKSVKGGTSLAWNSGDTVFMTVGSKNQERRAVIAKYSISGNNWTDELLPEGLVPKNKFKDGASIVYTPDGFFASVGQTPDLLKRDWSGNWTKVTDIPTTKKFSGDIAYNPSDNRIYANEGKNVANFNRYLIGGSWQNLTAWPLGREGKNPKYCALTCSDGIIYGVKGNNTLGFWEYIPPIMKSEALGKETENTLEQKVPIQNEKTIPTIMRADKLKRYINNFNIYDISGKKIDSNKLSSGVFFLIPKCTGKPYKVIIPKL